MANRPADQPDWEGVEQFTPDAAKKAAGWSVSERPPAGLFNWFWKLTSQWIAHLAAWTLQHDHKNTPGVVGSTKKIALTSEIDYRVESGSPTALPYGKLEVITNTPSQHVLRYSGLNGNSKARLHVMDELYAGQVGGGGYSVFTNPRVVLAYNDPSPSNDTVEVRLESGNIKIAKKAGSSSYSHFHLNDNIEVFSNITEILGSQAKIGTTTFTVNSSNSTFTSQATFNARINAKSNILHNDIVRTMAYDRSGGGTGSNSLSRMEFRTLSGGSYYDSTYLDARAYQPTKWAPTLSGDPYHGEALYQGNLTKVHGYLNFTQSTNANKYPVATAHGYNVGTVTRASYTGVGVAITASAAGWKVTLERPVKCDTVLCSLMLKEHGSNGVVPWEAVITPRVFNMSYNGSGELIWFMVSATVLDWDKNNTDHLLFQDFKNMPDFAYTTPNPYQIHFHGI